MLLLPPLTTILLSLPSTLAQSDAGYIGYSLTERGDADSAIYETADTSANVSTTSPPPDVYLNASVAVGEIDIDVQNLSAQINLQAQVLSLLRFNAGVDASIDQVRLTIQNVTAKVLLEARLANLATMIGDVLDSIDLNPTLVTLGQDVGQVVNSTVGGLTGSSGGGGSGTGTNATDRLAARGASSTADYDLAHNILYSVNSYSGHTHTNRILLQDGTIVDQSLDNDGHVYARHTIGTYATEMTFNGYNVSATLNGVSARELEYTYAPVPGVSAVCGIFVDGDGAVMKTVVLSEVKGGGGSTVDGELKV